MEHGTDFDLLIAIEEYLQEIDQDQLLKQEELDELFDHFLCEVEELTDSGMSEREAFAISKQRFGETSLISQEFERAKPFGSLKKTVISGVMLLCSMLILNSLLSLVTILCYRGGGYLVLTPKWIEMVDLGLKVFLLGSFATYLVYRIKQRPFFRKAELWLIPILGLVIPFAANRIVSLGYFRSNPFSYQKELFQHIFANSAILAYILLFVPVFICYTALYRAKRPENIPVARKRVITAFMLFFYFLVISSIISLISPISLNLGDLLGLSIRSISMADLVVKISLVIGLFTYGLYRLKKQVFFGKIELLVLPLLGFLAPILADRALFYIPVSILVNQELFRGVLQNSGWLYEISFLVLIVITYILVAKEQRRLTTTFL